MFWEYLTDMSYVLISLIGSIIAIFYVYIRKSKKRRAR
ncbi:EYxxD motif small membrane protein [Bacillus seohaeanensis]|uniref:EYxxD motif small membrane protein n=1 Tax=Bacillus seohaeanensis TaxID=284580 RepID=A0ABW5RWG3_9BACI